MVNICFDMTSRSMPLPFARRVDAVASIASISTLSANALDRSTHAANETQPGIICRCEPVRDRPRSRGKAPTRNRHQAIPEGAQRWCREKGVCVSRRPSTPPSSSSLVSPELRPQARLAIVGLRGSGGVGAPIPSMCVAACSAVSPLQSMASGWEGGRGPT